MANRLLEEIRRQERSINWAAKKRGNISRQGLTWKIEHNVFSDEDKAFYASLLNKPVAELFPEAESVEAQP